jgi:hypothetical protein
MQLQAAAIRGAMNGVPCLWLGFELRGSLKELLWPTTITSCRADGLWQHTCFEAFLSAPNGVSYCEINLSPSNAWAIYAFRAERLRDSVAEVAVACLEPSIGVQRTTGSFSLFAALPWRAINPASDEPGPIGLSAVLESTEGDLSHWALTHPEAHPDFHHRSGWTHCLDEPEEYPPA